MLQLLLLSALVSAIACAFMIRAGRRNAARYRLDMPQRFHAGHVPRLGGLGMLAGVLAGLVWASSAQSLLGLRIGVAVTPSDAWAWALPAVLACAGGSAEDITHRLRARWRLLATLGAGIAGAWLLGLRIPSLGVPWLDALWTLSPWPALLLAVLAVAGLPHALNLIDGYNGLAGTVAVVICLALAYVGLQVGDREMAGIMVVLAGASIGFLFWNYPRGLVFAGDGGAYLWGALIAVGCIHLTQRHPQVSPWFPILLLAYPVLETGFSIYRKLVRGQSPSMADALHIHQLIYRRIVRQVFDDDEARRMLMRNNRTSPYLWSFCGFTVLPAALFWRSTPALMVFVAVFAVLYVWLYVSIVRFKLPRWIRRR